MTHQDKLSYLMNKSYELVVKDQLAFDSSVRVAKALLLHKLKKLHKENDHE